MNNVDKERTRALAEALAWEVESEYRWTKLDLFNVARRHLRNLGIKSATNKKDLAEQLLNIARTS